MPENQKLFALLIDGDNATPSLVPQILAKVREYGEPLIRRVYSNKVSIEAWDEVVNKYSIRSIRVPNNTKGKNAADISLVIAAMDLLYNHPELEGFCIVSSDSDFTELASYIKEKRKFVLGIGKDQTPESFANACSDFIYTRDLPLIKTPPSKVPAPQIPVVQVPTPQPSMPKTPPSKVPAPQIPVVQVPTPQPSMPKASAFQAPMFETTFIQAYENSPKDKDDWAQLRDIKEEMKNLDSDFQSRDYQSGRLFAEKAKALAVLYPGTIEIDEQLDNKPVIHYVRIDLARLLFDRICMSYRHAADIQLLQDGQGWVKLSVIGDTLRELYGKKYKQLSKVVQQINGDYPDAIEIREHSNGNSDIRFA